MKTPEQFIEHGKRIRTCLKQAELQPMSVTEQVLVLLALTHKLFDTIPIEKMPDAEAAVRASAKELSSEVVKRLFSNNKFSDEDQDTILKVATGKLHSAGLLLDENKNEK